MTLSLNIIPRNLSMDVSGETVWKGRRLGSSKRKRFQCVGAIREEKTTTHFY